MQNDAMTQLHAMFQAKARNAKNRDDVVSLKRAYDAAVESKGLPPQAAHSKAIECSKRDYSDDELQAFCGFSEKPHAGSNTTKHDTITGNVPTPDSRAEG